MSFTEASGLSIESDVIEYRSGDSPEFTSIKMPGLRKHANISLKKGILPDDNEFYEWLSQTKMNKPQRRDITISLLNEAHEPVMTWKAKNAWPVKVEGPGLNSTGSETALETVEVAHEGLTILTS